MPPYRFFKNSKIGKTVSNPRKAFCVGFGNLVLNESIKKNQIKWSKMKAKEYQLKTLGVVKAEQGQFYIQLEEEYKEALEGLDGFSHISIIWWAHEIEEEARQEMLCEKPYKKGPQKLGTFATRSPARPNPIAITTANVLAIDKAAGTLQLPYIDAENGTPVIDIKPYQPCVDRIKEFGVPKWCSHWPKWYEDSAVFDWEAEFNF